MLEDWPQARCRHCQALTAGRHRVGRFPPGADLLDAEPDTSLRPVQAGKRSVVSFIQGRIRMHGQVGLAQLIKDQRERVLSTLEPARERVPTVFLDCDGVLAHFDGGASHVLGIAAANFQRRAG